MFVVVVVLFCCSSWLAFLILAYRINLMHHFYATELFALEAIFQFMHIFFEKYLLGVFLGFFWVFVSVPHLVDSYAKIVDERGRNLMCDRTLPSLLVESSFQHKILHVAPFDWGCRKRSTRSFCTRYPYHDLNMKIFSNSSPVYLAWYVQKFQSVELFVLQVCITRKMMQEGVSGLNSKAMYYIRVILLSLAFCGLILMQTFYDRAGINLPQMPSDKFATTLPPFENETYYYIATSSEWAMSLSLFTFLLTFSYEFSRVDLSLDVHYDGYTPINWNML